MRQAYQSISNHSKPPLGASQSSKTLRHFKDTCWERNQRIQPLIWSNRGWLGGRGHQFGRMDQWGTRDKLQATKNTKARCIRANGLAFGRMYVEFGWMALWILCNELKTCWKPRSCFIRANQYPFERMAHWFGRMGHKIYTCRILRKPYVVGYFRALVPLVLRLYIPNFSECIPHAFFERLLVNLEPQSSLISPSFIP